MQLSTDTKLPQAKGDELESAVHRIETAILNSNPALREKTFRIESKKWIEVAGVRHEIDVFVEVDMGHGYKANFIFECKNWTKSVGKNEIIVFSEKIRAVSAQKGFFVAQSFSKYAEAQAATDRRIELLVADQIDAPVPFRFHFVGIENIHADVEFYEGGATVGGRQTRANFDVSTATAFLDGERLDLKRYVDAWVKEERESHTQALQTDNLPSGQYTQQLSAERVFDVGRLQIDGMLMGSVRMTVRFDLKVSWPRVISNLEVHTRGRSIAFESVDGIQIGFVRVRAPAT